MTRRPRPPARPHQHCLKLSDTEQAVAVWLCERNGGVSVPELARLALQQMANRHGIDETVRVAGLVGAP